MSSDERQVPETMPGAEPADGDVPEHSRGMPLDEAQPSAPHKPQLDPDDDGSDG